MARCTDIGSARHFAELNGWQDTAPIERGAEVGHDVNSGCDPRKAVVRKGLLDFAHGCEGSRS